MKDILIKIGNFYIECELEGLKMDYVFSDEPKYHTVVRLKNTKSYKKLKQELNEMYKSCVNDEACDKVWLMRTGRIADPSLAARRLGRVEFLLEKHPDIPIDKRGRLNYTDLECGYWNGIMGALRWVLGDEKHFLDT